MEEGYDKEMSAPLLSEKDSKNESKMGQASFFSKLIFSWINPLLTLGFSKPLSLDDIPSLVSEDEAGIAYNRFKHAWESLVREKGSSSHKRNLVVSAILKVFFKENIIIAVLALLRTLAVVVLPLLLYAFVNYSNIEDENLYQGLSIVVCLIFVKAVESLSQRHWFFLARRSGMRMRSALMVASYEKQLKLSSLGRKRHSTGEIVNYIAVDAYRMGEFPWWLHSTWSLTLQLFLSIAVLFGIVGLGAVTGLVPLVLFGFLNVPFARVLQNCQSQFMVLVAQDERLRAMSEILNGMKIIKLQSWEEKFKGLMESKREKEFKWLSAIQLVKPYAYALYWILPTVISTVIFIGFAVFRSAPLNASTIFTVLATVKVMGEPVRLIPECMSILIQVHVSFTRINAFLLDHELKNENLNKNELETHEMPNGSVRIVSLIPECMSILIQVHVSFTRINAFLLDHELKNENLNKNELETHEMPNGSVRIVDGKFSWDPELPLPTLSQVNLGIQPGHKAAVCGPVGGGKSSLLYAILGEISKISGTVDVSGSIAYVAQTSWIQSGTVRENMLYGKPMNQSRYDEATKACALDKDINSFPHGDLTEIGQRGLNMSGGQKQRIQLARAVYNDADIYLLDDPFSAVDAHTAATLFHDCVMNALEKKIVVLVTHQVEFLSSVDRILVMEGGEITQSGSYEELLMAGTSFEQLVNAHKDSITTLGSSTNQFHSDDRPVKVQPQEEEETITASIPAKAMSEGVQLTQEEKKEIGDLGLKPFFDYLSVSKGTLLLLLGVVLQTIFITLQGAAIYWLAFAIEIPGIRNGALIGVYALISTLSVVFVYLRCLVIAHLGLIASKSFFSGFSNVIFKAPMSFFDSTPVGRILTRVCISTPRTQVTAMNLFSTKTNGVSRTRVLMALTSSSQIYVRFK